MKNNKLSARDKVFLCAVGIIMLVAATLVYFYISPRGVVASPYENDILLIYHKNKGNLSKEIKSSIGEMSGSQKSKIKKVIIDAYNDLDKDKDWKYIGSLNATFPNVESLVISGDVVEAVPNKTFERSKWIKSLESKSIKTLGNLSFNECESIEEIILPNLTTVEASAFSGCINLIAVVMPEVRFIGPFGFEKCEKIYSINFPKVLSIGDYSFRGCKGIQKTSFESLRNMNSGAFSECESLVEIDICNVEILKTNVFSDCAKLENIKINKKLKIINAGVVNNCNLLKTNIYDYLTPNTNDKNKNSNIDIAETTTLTISYTTMGSLLENIENKTNRMNQTEINKIETIRIHTSQRNGLSEDDWILMLDLHEILPNVKGLIMEGNAFENVPRYALGYLDYLDDKGKAALWLESVMMPDVKSIGYGAFGGCTSLKKVEFPNVIETLISFSNCNSLVEVKIPKLLHITSNEFYKCTSLESVSFEEAINIGSRAFEGCESLKEVNLPKTYNIEYNAFLGCVSLTNITLDSLEIIESGVFQGCKQLGEISLPKIQYIGSNAFDLCTNLTTYKFGEVPPSISFMAPEQTYDNPKYYYKGDIELWEEFKLYDSHKPTLEVY